MAIHSINHRALTGQFTSFDQARLFLVILARLQQT
jgi:hypothetical protein